LAQELLEQTDHGVEQVAADCGLAPMMLRRHFTRRWGITPQACRQRFGLLAG
jgi:transcriptional regulator GlxA family with amidase domain